MAASLDLFLDLDGVFADFDRGVFELLGRYPHQMKDGFMWGSLQKVKDTFYQSLHPCEGAQELWEFCKPYNPTFLTGVPTGFPKEASEHKIEWVKNHFNWDKIITCKAKDKCLHVKQAGSVLVDDRPKYADLWELAGGVFVHHTSAQSSIAELKALGFK